MRKLFSILFSVALVGGLFTGSAQAHAGYADSNPPSGAVLQTAPTTVKVWFTENLDTASGLTVKNASGTVVSDGPAQISTDNTQLLLVSLKPVGPGSYTVFWHSVSSDDMDAEDGQFSFQVQAPALTLVAATLGHHDATFNQQVRTMDIAPQVQNGYVYFPVRFLAEGLGGHVSWNPANRQVTGNVRGHSFQVTAGSATAFVDGRQVNLPLPVYIDATASRTMVPFTAFSNALGLQSHVNDQTGTLTIMQP
jgi:copper resistance protein C